MKQKRGRVGAALARTLFALAALILSLGPPLDALAHPASVAVEAGQDSLLLKLISTFDVIDDGLDQLPGAPAHDQQQLTVAPFSLEPLLTVAQPATSGAAWGLPASSLLHLRSPFRLDRPPRT